MTEERAEERDSAPPVAGAKPSAPSAPRTAADGLALYARAVVVRLVVLALGLGVLLAAQRWSLSQMRLAVALDGMAAAVTTATMMMGLNRFARAEEDGRAGGLAIAAVLVLLLELVCGLYATKLRLDMATESADVVLVFRALRSLPYVQTAAHALGLGAALVVLGALRKVAQRLGDAALARRAAAAAGFLGVITVGALVAPLAARGDGNGAFAYETLLFGVAVVAVANYVAVIFAARRAMSPRRRDQ